MRYLLSLPKALTPFKAIVRTIVSLSVIGGVIIALLNEPPVITSVTANPLKVNLGGSSTITCVASDPDGDQLRFSWSPTGGTTTGLQNKVTRRAPLALRDYTIYVTISDDDGGIDKGNCKVSVIPLLLVPVPP